MVQNPPLTGGAAGWLGQPSNQAGLMQAIGIPMAIMGAVEAARGKPVGAAYLEGIGGLLGEKGQQLGQTAYQTKTAGQARKFAEQRFPGSKGLFEAVAGIEDPVEQMKQMDELTKFLEGQQKEKPNEYDAFAQAAGFGSFNAAPTKAKADILQKIGAWKKTATGASPDWMKHPLGAMLYRMKIDPDKATPEQVDAAIKLDQAEKLGSKKELMKYAASIGLKPVYNADTGGYDYEPIAGAAGKPAKAPSITEKISGGYKWDPVPVSELGPGVSIGSPLPKDTLTGKGLELFGLTPPVLDYHGTLIKGHKIGGKYYFKIPGYPAPWTPP